MEANGEKLPVPTPLLHHIAATGNGNGNVFSRLFNCPKVCLKPCYKVKVCNDKFFRTFVQMCVVGRKFKTKKSFIEDTYCFVVFL